MEFLVGEGETNRRQVANLPQDTLKSEKAPDVDHFILESGGGLE